MDWNAASATLDERVAEAFDIQTFRVVPRTAGTSVNHGLVADTDRVAFEFRGTLELNPPGIASERRMATDPSGRQQSIFFVGVITALTTGWAYLPRRDDLIEHGAEVYRVMGIDADGSARRAIHVNRGR